MRILERNHDLDGTPLTNLIGRDRELEFDSKKLERPYRRFNRIPSVRGKEARPVWIKAEPFFRYKRNPCINGRGEGGGKITCHVYPLDIRDLA